MNYILFRDRARSHVNLITQLVGVMAVDKYANLDDAASDNHVTDVNAVSEERQSSAAETAADGDLTKSEHDIEDMC